MTISAAVIIAYLGFFTLFGLFLNRNNNSSADWAAGGAGMGMWMLAAGIAGTRIGGAGTYGVAGDVMVTGLGNLWYGVNSLLALVLVGLFFAVPYRRLKLVSTGQVFDRRFGSRRCQWLTSLCVQTEYLIINIIEPFVIGSIITGVTGLPFVYSVYLGGLVILTFTATGGLKGTGITNAIHCTVIIVGLATVGYVAMEDMGGWHDLMAQTDAALVAANIDQSAWWSYTGIGWVTIIALFFSATLHTPAASVYVNFSSSARREKDLLPAFFIAGILAAIMPMLAGFVGLEALAKYGSESGLSGYRAITQLATDTGPFIGGLALAAILGALISSGAPILLSSSVMFVNDWVPGAKKMSDERRLRAYKMTTVVYGLVATTIAWQANIGSVLQLLLLGYAMVVPPAIAIAYIFYWKKTTEKAAFFGILAGYLGGLLHWGLNTLFGGVEHASSGGFGQFWYQLCLDMGEWQDPTFSATIIPLIAIPLLTWFTQGEEDPLQRPFYRDISGQSAATVAA